MLWYMYMENYFVITHTPCIRHGVNKKNKNKKIKIKIVVYVHGKLLCDNTHTMYQTWCEQKNKNKSSGICTWKTTL